MNTKPNLEDRLNQHPRIKARIQAMLDLLDDPNDEFRDLDHAEEIFYQEILLLGREIIQDVAGDQLQKRVEALREKNLSLRNKGKKNSTGKRFSEK